eukprot:TRINITY_DN7148_c0_g1_i1.p1 TRINITY_DN7148_c0_g1~~TRINITY_DN7148_c0_g1_i1.p1  ORF type:complete len:240 (+),score=65.34 TRINITY_DN7148_c0_g1_i1:230-949(+)
MDNDIKPAPTHLTVMKEGQKDTKVDTERIFKNPEELKDNQTELAVLGKTGINSSKFVALEEILQPLNIVFIGQVEGGKSTICGNILILTGKVGLEEVKELEASEIVKRGYSWYILYVQDLNEEQRGSGCFVIDKVFFQTSSKRFTILQPPKYRNYVPNMIAGASQTDIAVLVISAKIGEFESGFEKDGMTKERAMLAKILGVSNLICVVNKMDTIEWFFYAFVPAQHHFELQVLSLIHI